MDKGLISIIIPTKDRSDFLIRALSYYRSVGFKGVICIGDSSSQEHSRKIMSFMEKTGSSLNIIYRYYSNPPYVNDGMCSKALVELSPSPYAVASGDDDFLIPQALDKCVKFLQDNPDYASAHGLRVAIKLNKEGAYGEVVEAHNCHQLALESEKAAERWTAYMRHAVSNLYSVHRIETLRNLYRYLPSVNLRYIGTEILTVGLSVISGKVKEIGSLSTVFQVNANNSLANRSLYSFLMSPEWSQGVMNFKDIIVKALRDKDVITESRAQEIFDREFWRFILSRLHWNYKTRYNEVPYENPILKMIKQNLKKIPGVQSLFHLTVEKMINFNNRRNLGSTRRLDLKVLLNPKLPFYADFMPVYKILTEESI